MRALYFIPEIDQLPRRWRNALAAVVLLLPFLILLAVCVLQLWRSTSIGWPMVVLLVVTVFYPGLSLFLFIMIAKLERATEVRSPYLSIKDPGERLPLPEAAENISYKHISLLHSSWRYQEKDRDYGRPMWEFHLIIVARDVVMRRIEYVQYSLHPDYPEDQRIARKHDSPFALKQLAWDSSVVRAEVKIREQETLVYLNRYINLTDEGPWL